MLASYYESRHLFSEGHLGEYLNQIKGDMTAEVRGLGRDILSKNIVELTSSLVEKYKLNVPVLGDYKATVAEKDVSYAISFVGDEELFRYCPSTFSLNSPFASITRSSILIKLSKSLDSDRIKSSFRSELENLNSWLDNVKKDVDQFNKELVGLVNQLVSSRVIALERDIQLEKDLTA